MISLVAGDMFGGGMALDVAVVEDESGGISSVEVTPLRYLQAGQRDANKFISSWGPDVRCRMQSELGTELTCGEQDKLTFATEKLN
jgi:hypothetical protein